MSVETGTVEKVENGWAWVKAQRKSGCASCSGKDHCHSMGGSHMLIQAKNNAGAVPGDEVEVFISTAIKMKCMFSLYIVPVFGLMAGAFSAEGLSNWLGMNHSFGMVVFSVGGLVAAYIIVKVYADRLSNRGALSPAVNRVLRRHAPLTQSG
ncbi:MAG: SoxR reducing system RseC family protein [Desulfobacteraceae bacterium]|nr:SoxR reducing system RseC family protein [Desulfobacteraceae bacterium]